MTNVFDIVLNSILARERHTIPSVVLSGLRFTENPSVYNIIDIKSTQTEKATFSFTKDSSGKIDFSHYKKELLYLKLFTTNIKKQYSDIFVWKHITKSTAIIKITDLNEHVFYMYIKIELKGHCESCDSNNELKYKIIYSSSFDDLVTFVYKPREMPDFLSSNAFVSTKDKTIDQNTILQNDRDNCIKTIDYDGLMNIIVDSNNHTIETTIADKTFRTRYKARHQWIVNEIITKGSETMSV